MLEKIASSIEMAFDVPEAEKEIAIRASERFKKVLGALDNAEEHLDIMYDPFKKFDNISTEAVIERRGVINRYKQKVKENYNKVIRRAFLAVKELNYFTPDSKIQELINSFIDSIQEVEEQVNIFLKVLKDYRAPDFREQVISAIDNIKKQSEQAENLIKDRIIEHIDANILATNWVESAGDELSSKIKDKIPLIVRLFTERQNVIEGVGNGNMAEPEKDTQALNPSDAQKITYPDFVRTMHIGE